VSSRRKHRAGNQTVWKLRLETAPPSGQLGGDEVSGGSRSSHHAGNRAVKRCRVGDSTQVVLWATAGRRGGETPSRNVVRATVRSWFGDSEPKHHLGTRMVFGIGETGTGSSFGQPSGDGVSKLLRAGHAGNRAAGRQRIRG